MGASCEAGACAGEILSKWIPTLQPHKAKNEDPAETRAVFVVRGREGCMPRAFTPAPSVRGVRMPAPSRIKPSALCVCVSMRGNPSSVHPSQDELSCIGCKMCVWCASATFRIDPEHGRSRAFAQVRERGLLRARQGALLTANGPGALRGSDVCCS